MIDRDFTQELNKVSPVMQKNSSHGNFENTTVFVDQNTNFNPFSTQQINLSQLQRQHEAQLRVQQMQNAQQQAEIEMLQNNNYRNQLKNEQNIQQMQQTTQQMRVNPNFVPNNYYYPHQQPQPNQMFTNQQLMQQHVVMNPQQQNTSVPVFSPNNFQTREQNIVQTPKTEVEIKIRKLEKLFKLKYITVEEFLRKKKQIIKDSLEKI